MEATEVISIAKEYVAKLFEGDRAINIGLEELSFDDDAKIWSVTIGFSRPWDRHEPPPLAAIAYGWAEQKPKPRTFKTIEISDADGKILGMNHRPIAA